MDKVGDCWVGCRNDGGVVKIRKDDVKSRTRLSTSVMPPMFAQIMSPEQMASMVAWLLEQKAVGLLHLLQVRRRSLCRRLRWLLEGCALARRGRGAVLGRNRILHTKRG